jgi:NADH:ubiquinone oxidoreductase subunit C
LLPDAARVGSALRDGGAPTASVEVAGANLVVRVTREELRPALTSLKGAGFDFMVDLFGIDTGDAVDIVYLLRSFKRDEDVTVKLQLAYDATLDSVWEVFPAAAFPEREAAELLGLRLAGHPHPRRLLTVDGTPPLLRKSVEIREAEQVRDRANDPIGLP